MKKILWLFVFIIILILGIGGFSIYLLYSPLGIKDDIYVTIQKNASIGGIVKSMNAKDLFEPAILFKPVVKIYAVFSKGKVHAGTYRFNSKNNNLDILKSVFTGKQLALVKVTFPEGINLFEFASICKKKLGSDSAEFVHIAQSDSIRKEFGIKFKSIEGYFYPATYFFFWKCEPEEIVRKLAGQSDKIWEQRFASLANEKGKSRHEILTLASIIEAETPVPSERSRVAGVYVNRLKKGRKLEADPTVQYAIGQKKKLSLRDLEYDSPYNTYRYYGLPPGPINSPSSSSIEAALEPENNDYIYFVAVGDGSGRHNFSKTFGQHEKFRAEYRRNVKK